MFGWVFGRNICIFSFLFFSFLFRLILLKCSLMMCLMIGRFRLLFLLLLVVGLW